MDLYVPTRGCKSVSKRIGSKSWKDTEVYLLISRPNPTAALLGYFLAVVSGSFTYHPFTFTLLFCGGLDSLATPILYCSI
ncbi:hypothetical protein K432DRAFT_173481 [Lepidopterella palustris CBS 459.81]|uniref:Uncharacterized protein n=1 Tax=Lepidopterella palustris CBS 459.81 TaxID=1314670 RepID=A0A8E2JI97_9PEZI|nr:hypothetical protein K432DRAFT_173481 [Lepidopterella palustris CBS 459.81]